MDELKQALKETVEPELDALISAAKIPEEHCFSDTHNAQMQGLIRRRNRKATVRKMAVSFAVVCAFLFATAMSVNALREPDKRFIVSEFFGRRVISTDPEQPGKPEIEEIYQITVPPGYELSNSRTDDTCIFVNYQNGDDTIYFGQYVKSTYQNVTCPEIGYYETDAYGQEYYIEESDGEICIVWDHGDYILHLICELDKEEALDLCRTAKIAESETIG